MSYATVTTTDTHEKDCADLINHAREVAADAARFDAVLEELTQEGTLMGMPHLDTIITEDRFSMVVAPLTNIYLNKEGK